MKPSVKLHKRILESYWDGKFWKYIRTRKKITRIPPNVFMFDYDYTPNKIPPILHLGDHYYEVLDKVEYIKGHARIELKRM